MHTIYAVIKRELERIRNNNAYKFLLFYGPLAGILILYLIFKNGAVRELPIAVVDHDNTSLSIKLSNAIDATQEVSVGYILQDLSLAKSLLDKGEIQGIVIIPRDTEKSVFRSIEAPIQVYINGTNVLVASLVQKALLGSVKTISAGIQMKKLMLSGHSQDQVMARILPISIDKHVLFNPYNNYNYYLGSAMMYIMLFLFVLLSSTYSLGNELKRGTGQDLLQTSNGSIRLAIFGKLIPYTIIFLFYGVLIHFILYVVDDTPLQGSFPVLFIGQFVAIITVQLLGLFFIALTSNLRLALSLVSGYSMMAITFSGLTFPLGFMPRLAELFGMAFPFTWWEKLYISQSLRGAPLSEALPYITYLFIFQAVSLSLIGRYKKHLHDPAYWGKA